MFLYLSLCMRLDCDISKTTWYFGKEQIHRSMEQNKEPKNKLTHINYGQAKKLSAYIGDKQYRKTEQMNANIIKMEKYSTFLIL